MSGRTLPGKLETPCSKEKKSTNIALREKGRGKRMSVRGCFSEDNLLLKWNVPFLLSGTRESREAPKKRGGRITLLFLAGIPQPRSRKKSGKKQS